jgi:hypothetical protein
MTPPITLQDALDFMLRNQVDDAKIYSFLSMPLNRAAIKFWLTRIDRINVMVRPSGVAKKVWEGRKNRVRGKCFEKLSGVMLKAVRPFTSWHSVNTTTNELDWLVQVGPTGQHVPALRQWGTHFICECKFTHDFVTVTWIDRLNTVLQTHSASVGVLMSSKGMTNRGRGVAAKNQMRLLAAMTPSRTIISVDTTDIHACANGHNFLQLLAQRYIEARIGADPLRLIQP